MPKYSLNRSVFIEAGAVLGLTEKQAALRRHQLRKCGDGLYETTAIVNFKAGETIAIDEAPRHCADALDEVVAAGRSAASRAATPKRTDDAE